jgi:hypothetical protein
VPTRASTGWTYLLLNVTSNYVSSSSKLLKDHKDSLEEVNCRVTIRHELRIMSFLGLCTQFRWFIFGFADQIHRGETGL